MTDEERRAALAEIIENVDQYGLGDGSRALDVALDAITDLFAPQVARIAEVEVRVAEARRAALEEAAKIAEEQLENTSRMLSNPPQSVAAWEIRYEIRALMEKKDD